MNCRQFEPLIALYAGHDLDDTTQVESHLAQCSECRELLEDLQASQSALKEWGADPVDAAFLASVRTDVLARIENRRKPFWPWVAVFATVAAAVIVFVATPPDPVPPPPPPPQVVAQMIPQIETRARAPRRKRVVRRKAEPLVVKMLTDDPDIIVIWLVDQTGE